jgi:8-oxo-dGTP diphosphatase
MADNQYQIRVRVAAVIVQDGGLLMVLHEKDGEQYWMLPGGSVDYGETLTAALERELREELCVEVTVGDLLFSNDSIAPDGARHIVNLYFHAVITDGTPGIGDDERVVGFACHPLDGLEQLTIRPAFGAILREYLGTPQSGQKVYLGDIWRD